MVEHNGWPRPPKNWASFKDPTAKRAICSCKRGKTGGYQNIRWLPLAYFEIRSHAHDQSWSGVGVSWKLLGLCHSFSAPSSLRSNMLQPSISPKVPNHVMQRHSTAEPIISELMRGDMSHSNTTYSIKGPLQITILGLCVYTYPSIYLSIYLIIFLSIYLI